MTVTILYTHSNDGKRYCELKFDKYMPYKAVVYESRGPGPYGEDWMITHESQPTWDLVKATQAYRRFVRKYIVKGE